MERREEYVFTRVDLTRGFKECCRVSRFPSPNYVTSKWRNWGREIKEQDTGFGVSPSPQIPPSPFRIRGCGLGGSGLVDKGFSVPRLMDRSSGARLHRTIVPALGWADYLRSEYKSRDCCVTHASNRLRNFAFLRHPPQ